MKKKLRRTLAIMLALFLTGQAFADHYVSVQAENTTITIEESMFSNDAIMPLAAGSEIQRNESGLNVSDFGVYLDRDRNNPMTDDSDIYSGQDVTVYFHWSLDDDTRMSDQDYDNGNGFIYQEFTINTNAEGFQREGIDLATFETGNLPLYSTDASRTEPVGYYYFEDGFIHIVITDGEFYQNTTNRVGGVAFHGKMEQLDDKTKDGQKKRVRFGSGEGTFDANPNFFLSENESGANVEKKRATNKVTVGADGKYYQTFIVTVKAENGTVKNIDLTDVTTSNPVDVLKNISKVEITASTVDGVTATTYANMETALEAIKNATFYMDQEVTLQYTMEVDAAIYEEGNTWANNGIKGSYTSNRGNKKNVESWASVNVTKPSIDKNAIGYEEDTGIITWEIAVNLGDYFQEGDSTELTDYLRSIEDIPVNGLDAVTFSLSDFDFEYQGNGIWKCTVTTPVTSDVKDSLGDVQVNNSVKMITKDGNEYHGEGSYTVEGQDDASVVKSVYMSEPKQDGLYVTWEIKVSDLPSRIVDFTLTDNPFEWLPKMGNQDLISEIYVGDTKVFGVDSSESEPKILDSTIISKVSDRFLYGYDYGEYSIVFQDDFIREHHSFVVYLKTLITEDTHGKEYGNSASISYKDENTKDDKKVKGNIAVYRETNKLLEKSGEVNGNAINYKLQIALSTMQLENGKDFVIEDFLPAGMKLVPNSVEVVLATQWHYEMLTLERGAYSLNTATSNGQRQKMTVTVKVQNNWLNRVVGHTNIQDPAYFLVVKYTATVNDAADFTIKGETIECINDASATYDGKDIGSDRDIKELTPANAVIKTTDYTQDTAPYAKYTVDVNPSGITLLDGTEKLQVVDSMGWALSLVDADSFTTGDNLLENQKKYAVKVIDVNDGYRELVKDLEYTYSISDDRRTMEMELPDSKYLKVEYWAYVNPTLPLSEENSTNRFNLSGFTSAATESSTSFSGTAFKPEAWAGSGDGQIILYKFWTDPDGNQQALLNSKFHLDRMRYDEQTDELVIDNNDDSADRYKFPREFGIDDNNRYGEGKLIIERLPVNYIFKLTEIEADEGFDVIQEPYYFTVDGTTAIPENSKYKNSIHGFKSNAVISYENYPMGTRAKIKISKTWSVMNSTNELQWEEIRDTLRFVIKDTSGQSADIVISGSDLERVGNTNKYESIEYSVAPGTYIVEENSRLPNGFEFVVETSRQVTGDVTVSSAPGTSVEVVLEEPASVEVAYDNTYTYTGSFPVKISKQAAGGQGEEIAGAGFKLIKLIDSSTKEVVKQWNSTSEPYEIDLVPGTYTLQETSAPQGYKIAQDITFTVEPDGKVTVGGNEVTDKTVVMRDEPLSLQVDKVLAGENTVIPGAILTLCDKNDLGPDGNLLPEDDGHPSWTTREGKSWEIGQYLYAGTNRTYVLVETKAPAGYSYSKNIEFKVEGDGGIIILSGDGHIDAATDSKILMEDKAISIKLSKLTLAGTELEGATIGLYKASDLDDNGIPKANTSPIGTWESGSEPFDFAVGRLEAGGQYALVEIAAPSDDYALAESIYFNVDKYGNIDVLGVAGMDLGETPEEPVIKMYDLTKEQKAERATLVLRKTIGGVLDINAPDILDKIGDLTFTVTGPIEEESSDRVYTIKDFLPPTPTRKSYELTIPNLTPGTYTVTESGYDVNGMNCTTTYTIEAVEASGELSPMGGGTAVETEGIELQGGHEVIVTYNNNYADKMGKILLTKSYESSGNALDWADISRNLTFRIYEVTDAGIKKEIGKSPISGTSLKWTRRNNENTYEYVIDVKTGKYIIEEIYTTIAGYDRTTSYRVTADGDTPADFTSGNAIPVNDAFEVEEGKTTSVEFVNKYVRNYPISISKRDINGTEELEGATLTVSGTPNDGSTFKTVTWTSGKQGTDSSGKLKPYELLLKPGKYRLTETTAPQGYALVQETIEFEIKDNGQISIIVGETKGAVDSNTLILKDAPLDIQVSKVDITGANEVKDATLVVYLAKDVENGRPKANSTPVIEPWVSADTGQPKDIGSYLEVGETYVLIETGAPKGYAYSESIEFTVNADGSITTDNAAKYQGNTVHTDPLETTMGNRILMRDEAISIKLNKVELNNTAKELEGAVIGIYDADAVDADGRLINSDTRPLEAWKSEIGGCHEFGAELKAGHDYVFVETATPDGYKFATSIRFTIKEDGSVANVSTVTGETVNPTRDAVYLMEDDINTDPRATLVLTKSIEGEGIRPTDITKTNLRFHVESVDLSPAYDRVFYVGSAGFEWDSTESMYIQHIYNLTPGKYKVTELWDDSTASGIVCTGQTWEIVPAGATVTGSPSGTGVTTGEINLEDGDTIVVNYTNTYDPPKDPPTKLPDEDPDDPPDETEGTLIITKTIAGDAKKEEVEGTLTFTVTENSTGKKAVYTLKDDFKYNSETKQWTKKLVLTAGGYTVEESGNALDGKTCTTRYTVTGETSRNGVGTQVTNVVVEQGGTTTVAYTNTYTVNPRIVNKDDNDDGDSPELLKKVSNVANSLTKTGDGAPIAAWLLLLLFGVAEAIDAGYALSHRKKKDGTHSLE